MPYIDTRAAELLLRQKVIALLAGEGLLDEDRIELLDSWKSGGHSGFSAHNTVIVQAEEPPRPRLTRHHDKSNTLSLSYVAPPRVRVSRYTSWPSHRCRCITWPVPNDSSSGCGKT